MKTGNHQGNAMSTQRDELRTKATEHGWVLAYSCRTLDQFNFAPDDEGKAQREVAAYFSAAGGLIDGYETYWDQDGKFLGRPVAAADVLGVISGVSTSTPCVAERDDLGDTA